MAGDSSPATSTSTSSPWSPQQPFLQQGFQQALQRILNGPNQQTFSPQTQTALNNTFQQNQGVTDPNLQAASKWNQDILAGSGPGFDQQKQSLINSITPQLSSQFAAGGRYGSGLSQNAEAQGITNGLINKQGEAAQLAPMLDTAQNNLQQGALNQQLKVGNAYDALNRQNMQSPQDAVLNFMRAIGGNYGGTTNTVQTPASGGNNWLTGIGSALLGSSLFGPLGGGMSGLGDLFGGGGMAGLQDGLPFASGSVI